MPGKIAGKVLRNWTSLGEEWRFTYHDGYTEVTDVLGRTEQYHYDYNNELTKRVFCRRQHQSGGMRQATPWYL